VFLCETIFQQDLEEFDFLNNDWLEKVPTVEIWYRILPFRRARGSEEVRVGKAGRWEKRRPCLLV
jgi:hypothetical protein